MRCNLFKFVFMKTVLIIRHAKSSWGGIGQKDFERPLDTSGETDAATMALKIFNKNIPIDLLLSSTANRAATTCLYFAAVNNIHHSQIVFLDKLYNAPEYIFTDVIAALDNTKNTIAIFAHNPGITEYVSTLCSNVEFYDMPPCGIFAVSAKVDSWVNFENAEKEFLFFEQP